MICNTFKIGWQFTLQRGNIKMALFLQSAVARSWGTGGKQRFLRAMRNLRWVTCGKLN